MSTGRSGLTGDARLLVAAQGVRAAGYGFTAVLLGALLADRGFSHLQVGVVLTALIAGTALASLVVGRFGDRIGRRRSYALFFGGVAAAGVVVAAGAPLWALLVVALTGTLSTDVVDNGPATTLEQAMLATEDAGTAAVYGRYNTVGAAAGALGALAVSLTGPGLHGASGQVHAWLFLVLVPVGITGAVLAARLSAAVEPPSADASTLEPVTRARSQLGPSRALVRRLAALFAVDAAGGGLVTTGFLSYYFAERYHVSVVALGWLFFAVSVVQAVSVALAPLLARRFGLVATMVGTHLPSNVLLAAVAFAPSFAVAAVRSPGVTTVMTSAWRVGTSICDSVVRASSSPAAAPKVGAKATAASSRLLGRWVPTMVATRPNRRASNGASATETACTTDTAKNSQPSATTETW